MAYPSVIWIHSQKRKMPGIIWDENLFYKSLFCPFHLLGPFSLPNPILHPTLSFSLQPIRLEFFWSNSTLHFSFSVLSAITLVQTCHCPTAYSHSFLMNFPHPFFLFLTYYIVYKIYFIILKTLRWLISIYRKKVQTFLSLTFKILLELILISLSSLMLIHLSFMY